MGKELTREYFNEFALKSPEAFRDQIDRFREIMMMYNSAIKEIKTKLEIFSDEFDAKDMRSPIDSIKSRIKRPVSIFEKMQRRDIEVSMESIMNSLSDIAGIRVICPFIDDIYMVSNMLTIQDDIKLIEKKDYIIKPKENGYRSLHLIVEVPVFFSDRKVPVKAEIQIRTIAMDFWASLEHEIHYKKFETEMPDISRDLKECSEVIFETDIRMQDIHKKLKKTAT